MENTTDMLRSKLYFDSKYLVLVNKTNPIDLKYFEEHFNVSPFQTKEGNFIPADFTAYYAVTRLIEQMKNEGFKAVIGSAFRTYEDQELLYNNSLNTRGPEYTETHVAPVGYSAHHLGSDFDINLKEIDFGILQPVVDVFKRGGTKVVHAMNADTYKDTFYKKLAEVAPSQGFILRYPEGKTEQTGYVGERWHFSYVGGFAPLFYLDKDGNVSKQPTFTMEEFSKFICHELKMSSLRDADKQEKITEYFSKNKMPDIAKKVIEFSSQPDGPQPQ